MIRKFKKGDKVVVTVKISRHDLPEGTVATIKRLEDNKIKKDGSYDPEIFLVEDEDETNWYGIGQIELEVFYNAPLNKALR